MYKPNSRLYALPCERMRGCSFADDFVSRSRVATNCGQWWSYGPAIDRGAVFSGDDYSFVEYDIISQSGSFTVVVEFSCSTLNEKEILVCNADLTSATAADGFCIWVEDDAVKANHSDGVTIPDECSIDFDYSGGNIQRVVYVVNKTTGKHKLYINGDLDDEKTTTITCETGASYKVIFGGYSYSGGFIGTIFKSRIFDVALSDGECLLYATNSLTDFYESPWAKYRCDDIGDDSVGNRIIDSTVNCRNIIKGDGSNSRSFPSYSNGIYSFDGNGDYLSGFDGLPDEYTVSTILSDDSNYPYCVQSNDDAMITSLETAGDYEGYLHSLVIYSKELTQIEKNHDEYTRLYYTERNVAKGLFIRLITEDVCQLALFFNTQAF